jgi:DNA-binding GntR family transcriptional regulator
MKEELEKKNQEIGEKNMKMKESEESTQDQKVKEMEERLVEMRNSLELINTKQIVKDKGEFNYLFLKILTEMSENLSQLKILEKIEEQLSSISQQLYDRNQIEAAAEGLEEEQSDEN